jgi:hypothetical protein
MKTGNQNVIKSHDSFSFNPNIFNFSSKNVSASSALTIKPFVKSLKRFGSARIIPIVKLFHCDSSFPIEIVLVDFPC